MEGRCDKHLFEQATDVCRECGYEFCPECLIYAFGPKQPPYCVPCAVTAAGIRRNAGNAPSMSKAQRKQMLKERKAFLVASAKEAKDAAKAARRAGGEAPVIPAIVDHGASGPTPPWERAAAQPLAPAPVPAAPTPAASGSPLDDLDWAPEGADTEQPVS